MNRVRQISFFIHIQDIFSIVYHLFLIISIASTIEEHSGIDRDRFYIHDTEGTNRDSPFFSTHTSTRSEARESEVDIWIISLEKEIEKSSKYKNNEPKYSGSISFFADFFGVGVNHSYLLRVIFWVVSKLSIRLPKNRRIWLSIAGMENSVRVSIGTAIH